MLFDVFLETTTEFRDVLLSQGESYCVGVTTEVLKDISAVFDGIIDVESCYGTCRSCRDAIYNGENDSWPLLYFRQA